MGLSEGLNLLALVIVPLVAVVVGQYLQTRSKKKDEQYKIFKELLRSRVFGINAESVETYNMIHIVFSSHKEVRKCWDAYFASLCVENPSEDDLSDCEQKQLALLKEMAKSLGYGDELSQAALATKYLPKGMVQNYMDDKRHRENYANTMEVIGKLIANNVKRNEPPK